ncbi:MAG: Zn-ribbon domain-containing OB-fold protein [Acidimicrobiia bacterium]
MSEIEALPPVTLIKDVASLEFDITSGFAPGKFLRGVKEGKLFGQRCPQCHKVTMPPRGSCAKCGVPTTEEVECGPNGTVTTFCVVNLQFHPSAPPPPYVCAQVLLDGADMSLFGLIIGMPADEVRMGVRVHGVWNDPDTWGYSIENMKGFEPNGEADADYETYKEYL